VKPADNSGIKKNVKDKINEVAMNSKNENITDLV
jgi:hypothetical protein